MSAPLRVINVAPRRTKRIGARVCAASFVVIATLVSSTTGSVAATPSRAAQQRAAYCKLLSSFNKKENTARKVYSSITSPVPSMKAAYKALNGVAVQVLHVAPAPLKGTYTKEVSSLHEVYSDLAKVNFDYLSLPESEIMSFESIQTSITSATKKIATFDKKFCGAKNQ
jgi:hypothetical protein